MVEGTYEERFKSTTPLSSAESSLKIQFQGERWVKMGVNETGRAEFSDLPMAPPPTVNGAVSLSSLTKSRGRDYSSGASTLFSGRLEGEDVVIGVPEYSNSGDGLKLSVSIRPRLKGKCATNSFAMGRRSTSTDCRNPAGLTTSLPITFAANDDRDATPETANKATFGINLTLDPALRTGGTPSNDYGTEVWRGAVTNGSKDAGFKITLAATRERPLADGRGQSTQKLEFTAKIVPAAP